MIRLIDFCLWYINCMFKIYFSLIIVVYFSVLYLISDKFIKKNDIKTANKIGFFGVVSPLVIMFVVLVIKAF